ncbi:DUF58 domain-containing protein [Luteimonas sp. MC1828]|uniref:DUF58 domain-containing protein n=1 Tax=Luteimonas sp. MC1828 TaxID=2799787 RepID=UPI0018F167E2|nr:DUF58 domain-containing protein [Luteimonas sp. MC1828]MBJ7575978.1 DUF58 domain-containing protein [Luteimonas sp. MC1828]
MGAAAVVAVGTATGGDGVTPSLAELIALRGIAQASVSARRGAAGVAGPAPSTLRGRGMEYAESRAYAAGDDARHIDWRLTARSGKPHTKLFQAERERLTLLVADTSPALYFGTRVRFKSVQAARAGALAAWRAVRDGDRVAALRGSVSEPPVPPASGPRGALRVLDALVRWYATPPADDAGLEVALDHARRLLRPGSRLLVLADPASVAAIPQQRWPALAAHHEVLVLLLTDPLEVEPPRGMLAFSVASSGAPSAAAAASGGASRTRIELDLASTSERERWRRAFDVEVEDTIATLAARGVRALRLSTADASDAWLALPATTARSA